MLFSVNDKLTIEIKLPDKKKVSADVRAITQPFTAVYIASRHELPSDTELYYQLYTGGVPLVKGKGMVIRAFKVRSAYHYGLNAKILDPQSIRSITERLAPFVMPKERSKYFACQEDNGDGTPKDTWLLPMIESSYRLNLLLDLIARINTTMDTQILLSTIMEAAKEIMEAEASSLMILDKETEELVITVPTGSGSEDAYGIRIPKGKGVSGWVLTNEKPLVLEDARKDPRFFGDVAKGFETKTLICVPLKNPQGEIVGVIEAINKRDGSSFKEADVPIFSTFADQVAIALEKDRLYQESLQKKLLEKELETAMEIQKYFWPKEIPSYPGIELAGMSKPATQVGGDYYDFIPIDENQCAVVIADVTGKGVQAGLLMATLRAALRAQVEGKRSIEETLFLVNNVIVRDTPTDKFVTLFYGFLDAKNREFTYINAGHNPPYLLDTNTGKLDTLTEGGLIVGVMQDYRYKGKVIKLKPGQMIVMFTDGVTEAMNRAEEYFDEERLEKIIINHPHLKATDLMEKIYQSVKEHSKGVDQYDDITMVIMKVSEA